MIFQKPFVLLFFSSLLLSILITPRTRMLAVHLGAVDVPDPRKVHGGVIPRLGGLGIAVSVVLFLFLFGERGSFLNAFLIGAFLTASVGFLDDVYHFRPVYKLFGQIVAASVFVSLADCSLRSLGDLAAVGEVRLGSYGPLFTVFCMVGVINALNLSDGLDGLAGGISAIACFFLGSLSILQGDWLSFSIATCLLGSLFGFLRYNTFPAKLFMGDTGSMLLGFSLSAVAVRLAEFGGEARVSPVTIATVLALPILDTLLVMGRRAMRGEGLFRPDKKHLHHQLLGLGFSHAAVVPILYGVMTAFGVTAWAMRDSTEWMQFAAVLALGATVYGSLHVYRRVGGWVSGRSRERTRCRNTSPPIAVQTWLTRSLPWVSLLIGTGLCIPVVLSGPVWDTAGLAAFAVATFVVVLFPWQTRRRRSTLCSGLLYSSCVCLMGILQLRTDSVAWVGPYMAIFSVSLLAWVLLVTKFRPVYFRSLAPTGFETLLIVMCLLVPLVVPAMGLEDSIRRAVLMASVESIPIMLAFKILVRERPAQNLVFVVGFLAVFLFLGIRGTWPVDEGMDRNPYPTVVRAIGKH